MQALHATFVAFENLTQLDLTGPWQVLERVPGLSCTLAAYGSGPVRAHCGLRLLPDAALAAVSHTDLLLVPGGPGVDDLLIDSAFLAEIRRLAEGAHYVTSVCTGSLLLGAAGLLRGKRATCHWASLDLIEQFGASPVTDRVVRDGNTFTGGGVTAGIDFGLLLAAELAGEEVARTIQMSLEYAPEPPFASGRPDLDPEAAASVRRFGKSRRLELERRVKIAAATLH